MFCDLHSIQGDALRIGYFIHALPNKYSALKTVLKRETYNSLTEVTNILLEEAMGEEEPSLLAAHAPQNRRNGPNQKPWQKNKTWQNKKQQLPKSADQGGHTQSNIFCIICGKIDHKAEDCYCRRKHPNGQKPTVRAK